MSTKRDRELGLDRPITRRDFVYGSALVVGGAMAGCGRGDGPISERAAVDRPSDYAFDVDEAWYGPGGVGDYASSHGNTPGLLRAAHEIRAGRFDAPLTGAIDSGEEYDLVVVGGGFAGLSAAHHFQRLNPGGSVLILDNHPIFGGEAKRNDFDVAGVHVSGPQGSNDFGVPAATGAPDDYFTALGITRDLTYADPGGGAAGMRIPNENYGFLHWQEQLFDVGHHFRGTGSGLVKDVWGAGLESTPWSPDVRAAFLENRQLEASTLAEGRELGPWLDSMTIEQYYREVAGLPPEIARYMDPIFASIIGLGTDAISAWWGAHFELPGFKLPDRYAEDAVYHSFPGGNAAIARHFVRHLIPGSIAGSGELADVLFGAVDFSSLDRSGNPVRIRLGATVVRVEHAGPVSETERVRITYTVDGDVRQLSARTVVMASGGWVNRHIVKDLPEGHRAAYETFGHSPVLVANVALTNWRFLERLGVSAAMWDEGFGFACNIRRPMVVGGKSQPLHPDQPTVMTFYAPIYKPGLEAKAQGVAGRAELLGTSFSDYERQIREKMVELFDAGGFDPTTDVAGIILNRWGHAYVNPGPGFMFGKDGRPAPPDVIREPIGRIAIGHSELRGHQNWTGATAEGRRAVELLLDQHF